LLGLPLKDIRYLEKEDRYLSTVLGLLLLSGFLRQPFMLITSNKSVKALLNSTADMGAIQLDRSVEELAYYRISFLDSIFLRSTTEVPSQLPVEVFALNFSHLHLFRECPSLGWLREQNIASHTAINMAKTYRLKKQMEIPDVDNIPVIGSPFSQSLLTIKDIKQRYTIILLVVSDSSAANRTSFKA
jgi:hypothetical protein